MRFNLEAHGINDVWRMIKRPSSRKALHTKLVYQTETTADKHVERQKERLVTFGIAKRFEVDYVPTFASLIDMSTVYIFMTAAAMQ